MKASKDVASPSRSFVHDYTNPSHAPWQSALQYLRGLGFGVGERLRLVWQVDACDSFDQWSYRYPVRFEFFVDLVHLTAVWTERRHRRRAIDWPLEYAQVSDPRASQAQLQRVASKPYVTRVCCGGRFMHTIRAQCPRKVDLLAPKGRLQAWK